MPLGGHPNTAERRHRHPCFRHRGLVDTRIVRKCPIDTGATLAISVYGNRSLEIGTQFRIT